MWPKYAITVLNERQKQSFIKSCNRVLQNAAEIKKERSSVEMTDGINKMKLSPIKNAQDIKDENLEILRTLRLHPKALAYAENKVLSGEYKKRNIEDFSAAATTGELNELDADTQISQLDAMVEKRKKRNSENITDIHKDAFDQGSTNENVVEDVYSLALDTTNKMIETLNHTPQLMEAISPEKKEHLSKKLEELHEVTENVISNL